MKYKTALHVAYYLVTSGFTLGLLGFVLFLITFFTGDIGVIDDIEIQILSGKHSKVKSVIEDGIYLYDTTMYTDNSVINDNLQNSNMHQVDNADWLSVKNVMKVPVENFKNSRVIQFYYSLISFLLIYLAWLYIAYQIFLVLYDIKKDQYFMAKNPVRIRKAGVAFILIALLKLVKLKYSGIISEENELHIDSVLSGNIINQEFLFYLATGLLMLVLSMVFQHGARLKEEAELTV